MAEAEKIMNIAVDDIEKIMNIETGDIEKIMNIEVPTALTTPTVSATDVASTMSVSDGTSKTSTLTVADGTNRCLVCVVIANSSGATPDIVTGITYNGDAFTEHTITGASDDSGTRMHIFSLVAPDVGSSQDLVVTKNAATASQSLTYACMQLTGVDQTTPITGIVHTMGNTTRANYTSLTLERDMGGVGYVVVSMLATRDNSSNNVMTPDVGKDNSTSSFNGGVSGAPLITSYNGRVDVVEHVDASYDAKGERWAGQWAGGGAWTNDPFNQDPGSGNTFVFRDVAFLIQGV